MDWPIVVETHQEFITRTGEPPVLRCEPGEVPPEPCSCAACEAWRRGHEASAP